MVLWIVWDMIIIIYLLLGGGSRVESYLGVVLVCLEVSFENFLGVFWFGNVFF